MNLSSLKNVEDYTDVRRVECYLQNMLASDLSHSSVSSHAMEAQYPSKVRASAIISLFALLHVRKTCVAGRAGAAKRSPDADLM